MQGARDQERHQDDCSPRLRRSSWHAQNIMNEQGCMFGECFAHELVPKDSSRSVRDIRLRIEFSECTHPKNL